MQGSHWIKTYEFPMNESAGMTVFMDFIKGLWMIRKRTKKAQRQEEASKTYSCL
jgi:hypothetical protein